MIKHFKQWAERKDLSSGAIEIIKEVRDSDPSRKVDSRNKNVSGFYPSRKMGVTIQFESHTVELAGIYENELDDNVIEYYDQPPSFNITYRGKKRKMTHQYTPDFFLIKNDWIGWEEWKTEDELNKLQEKNPDRYYKDENNNWRCPPAEAYAKDLGLSFRVRSDQEIIWERLNNIKFLEDYLYNPNVKIPNETKEVIINIIKDNQGISLYDLIILLPKNIPSDYIYYLIVTNEIYCDLDNFEITNYKKFLLYADELTQKAYVNIKGNLTRDDMLAIETLELNDGSSLRWGSNVYEIINSDEENIWLMSQSGPPKKMSVDVLYQLVENGEIRGNSKRHLTLEEEEKREIVNSMSQEEMRQALRMFNIVSDFLITRDYSKYNVPDRTLRRWRKNYEDGEKLYNSGFLGLIPQTKKKGNRQAKITDEQQELMEKVIREHYETNVKKNMSSVHRVYKRISNKKLVKPVTYKTFRKYIKMRPIYDLINAREGRRAAYAYEEFYWNLDCNKTPRHGKRPFEILHLDHTELDIELVCSETGKNLGRPWVTFAVDAFSRRILAFYLTFDKPSYKSNMMVLREMVKRFKRMPSIIVVDKGSDFQSIYFDTLLAVNKVIKKVRPKADPKFGSVIERLFGTINTTLIYNLLGNTQATKHNIRLNTPEIDPKKNAVWTLELLYEAMKEFVYKIYDNTHHITLNNSPKEVFTQGLKLSGLRKQTFITDFELFKMLTLPSTRGEGKAKVQPVGYIQINTFRYWNDILRNPKFIGRKVMVRYDPFDISVAYAFLDNQWVKLDSDYKEIFRGITEKERKMLSSELKRRNTLNGDYKDSNLDDLVNFMQSSEGKELTEIQRKKDRANKAVLQAINTNKEIAQIVSNNIIKEDYKETPQIKSKKVDTGKDILKEIQNLEGFGRFDYV